MAKRRQLKMESEAAPGAQLDALLRALAKVERAVETGNDLLIEIRDSLALVEERSRPVTS